MAKPTLKVIQGTAGRGTVWLDFPATIVARSPLERSQTCRLRVSREDATKAARAHRLQPIWEFWSIVIGEPPPVPNVRTWGVNVPAEEGVDHLGGGARVFSRNLSGVGPKMTTVTTLSPTSLSLVSSTSASPIWYALRRNAPPLKGWCTPYMLD
jgi:hypothetical protein